jgi:hypothetical protein
MHSVWCVRFGDTEKNFARKVDAVSFLRQRTNDQRIRPVVVRHCRGAYTFYGPGRDALVLKASIDQLGFASVRRRR